MTRKECYDAIKNDNVLKCYIDEYIKVAYKDSKYQLYYTNLSTEMLNTLISDYHKAEKKLNENKGNEELSNTFKRFVESFLSFADFYNEEPEEESEDEPEESAHTNTCEARLARLMEVLYNKRILIDKEIHYIND